MFGDEIILRGEAAYQNVKGTFPGNRGYLVGSSLAGKPYPPHGIAVVWTGNSWKPEGITPLDSVDDLQTYAGAEGAVASVLGVQYTYGAGGWAAVKDGGLSPTIVNGPLRICTFGSSIATPNPNVPEFDIENLVIPIPASGTLNRLMSPLGAPSLYMGHHYLVGVGGIGGQTTSAMMQRCYATPSTTRKSITDIVGKKPHVILMMGGCINDISGTLEGANVDTVAQASFATHKKLIDMCTSQGVHVIDMGVYGFSGGTVGHVPTVQAVAVKINNLCAAINSKYYHYWKVDGIMGSAGGFYPNNTTDGIHLSTLGAYLAGNEQKKIIDSLFDVIGGFGAVIYDGCVDWGIPTSGVPRNCSITPSMVGVTKVSDSEKMVVSGTVATIGQGLTFKVNALATILSGLSAGDKFIADINIDVFDADGNPSDAFVDAYFVLNDVTNANALLLGQTGAGVNGQSRMTISACMPQNAPIGSSSYIQVAVKPFATGGYNLAVRPIMVYRQ